MKKYLAPALIGVGVVLLHEMVLGPKANEIVGPEYGKYVSAAASGILAAVVTSAVI